MKRYRITLEDHTFDVKVLDDPRREQVRVEIDGEIFTVGVDAAPVVTEVARREATLAAAPAGSASLSNPSEAEGRVIAAPLPGVIKSIGVRPGQGVAADDELLVIEAMKMDNVIRASRGGTVGTIHVAEGRQVAYGEPLLEMSSDKVNNEQ